MMESAHFLFPEEALLTWQILSNLVSAFSLLELNTFQKVIVDIPVFFVPGVHDSDHIQLTGFGKIVFITCI